MLVPKLKSIFEGIVTAVNAASTILLPNFQKVGAYLATASKFLPPELQQLEAYRLAAEKQERTPAQITVDQMLEESYLKYVGAAYEAGEKPVSYFTHRVNTYGTFMSAVAAMERLKTLDAQLTQRL